MFALTSQTMLLSFPHHMLEMMLEEHIDEDTLEREIKTRTVTKSSELDNCKVSKYIELTANILTQNE